MYLKADFLQALKDEAGAYPAAKAALAAKDPRFDAQLNAMATMLAMISAQVDVAATEWVTKARDGTVLADAALRGILPLGKPARLTLSVTNKGAGSCMLATGRGLTDPKGRPYVIEGGATVPVSDGDAASATVSVRQVSTRSFAHTVTVSAPFAEVLVPSGADDAHLVGLSVADAQGAYTYKADFFNVSQGTRVFTVETDEYRRVWLRFGAADVTGQQPQVGDVLTVTVTECQGAVADLDASAPFALEYLATGAEQGLSFAVAQVSDTGAGAPSIEQLRVMARYPGLHDDNPVYRAQWDYYLRNKLGANLRFLAVWNEQVEEAVRGASVDSVNKLFVAAVVHGQTPDATRAAVSAAISRADDSYRIGHVDARECEIPMVVKASIPAVFDPADVEAQIRTLLLASYGRGTAAASRGLARSWRHRDAHELLAAGVNALQDAVSDFSISVGSYGAVLPEDWAYVSEASITVELARVSEGSGMWTL